MDAATLTTTMLAMGKSDTYKCRYNFRFQLDKGQRLWVHHLVEIHHFYCYFRFFLFLFFVVHLRPFEGTSKKTYMFQHPHRMTTNWFNQLMSHDYNDPDVPSKCVRHTSTAHTQFRLYGTYCIFMHT